MIATISAFHRRIPSPIYHNERRTLHSGKIQSEVVKGGRKAAVVDGHGGGDL